MNQVGVDRSFRQFVKVMYVLSFIPLIISALTVVALLIFSLAVAFVPQSTIDKWFTSIPVTFVPSELSSVFVIENVQNVVLNKWYLFALIMTGLIMLVLFFAIFFMVNRWLLNLRNNHIFTLNNSKTVEYVGILLVIAGAVSTVFSGVVSFITREIFVVNEALFSSEVLQMMDIERTGVTFDIDLVYIFCGILIWMVGRIFRYGTYLQSEYDSTV